MVAVPTACPRHGDTNQVSRVSGLMRTTTSAALREQFRPAPPQAPVTGPGEREALERGQPVHTPVALRLPIVIFAVGFLVLVVLAVFAAVNGSSPAAAVGAGICFAVLVVLGIVIGFQRAGQNRRVARGMPHALELWSEAYYCAHCDGVFFPASAAELGAPVGEVLSLYRFRQVIWGAGGYADLA